MQEDNIYPTSYYNAMKQPQEAKKANEEEEKRQSQNMMPAIEESVKVLRSNIEKYSTISSIPDEVLSDPTDFMNTIVANKQTVANLRPILEKLEDIVKTYKR